MAEYSALNGRDVSSTLTRATISEGDAIGRHLPLKTEVLRVQVSLLGPNFGLLAELADARVLETRS